MPKRKFPPSEVVKDSEGRLYHIGLKKGDIAPFILMCGDPARVRKGVSLLDSHSEEISSREYITVTGKYKGLPVSIMATGMGPDNTEIAVVELLQIVECPTMIRVGSSGALKRGIKAGELVISTGAVRLENTSTQFVVDGFPALAHHEVVMALLEAAHKNGLDCHLGLTATAPGFYGAQGRETPHFKPRKKEIIKELAGMNVTNMEMESSALFTLAALAGFRAGAICSIFAERGEGRFIDPETKKKAEMDSLRVALDAALVLSRMDKARGGGRHWVPSMGM